MMNRADLVPLMIERLREIDLCLAEVSSLIRVPPQDREELRRMRSKLDSQREAALDQLRQYLQDHGTEIDALPPTRQVCVARELLGAAMMIRKVRLFTDARREWEDEFYWDLYYIENRLFYATLRELDPLAEERQHM